MQCSFTVSRFVACTIAFALLSACPKEPAPPPAVMDEPASELKWARAALERNPDLKVVSVDNDRNTIKVTVKSTGETAILTPGELAAIPIGDLVSLTQASKQPATPTVTEVPLPAEPSTTTPAAPPVEKLSTEYKVEHQDGGRVKITGPGMNVEATGMATVSGGSTPTRFDEPIICEGKRMMHLDRRRMNVDGNAITVRGGCELHLTNSEITATGVAIVVQDGTAHIGNSTIQGSTASYDAGPAANLYLLNNRFGGTARRDANSNITNQGGNVWR